MSRPIVLACAAFVLAAGCTTGPGDVDLEATGLPSVVVPVPVHIVLVGTEPGLIDTDTLVAQLPVERRPLVESVSGTTGTPTYQPVLYTFTYAVHEAPTAFADGFFRAALDAGAEGRPNAWLVEYDRTGPQRLCDPCLPIDAGEPKDILYLDAMKTETWVQDNRATHGLAFEPGSVTIFLLDGENAGVFPTDTYHYWRFDDGHGHAEVPRDRTPPTVHAPIEAMGLIETPPFHTPKDPISMRAWGGRFDFVWLDLTAAPSAYDFTPRRPSEDWTDPPLWDLEDEPARLLENLGRDLGDLLRIRVARDPIYPVRTYERFATPIHVFVEAGAQENPRTGLGVDLKEWVPQDDIQRSIQRVMPWNAVETPVMFHFLPEDDPAMTQTLAHAKRYSDPTLVAAGVVKADVRDRWGTYAPEPGSGDFVIPQFYFYFNGPYTFWGVSTAGGWADGDAWGRPWAIFDHFFDVCVRTDVVPCTKATIGFRNITLLPIHEAAHELGLTHTKDSVTLGDDGWVEGHTNWLWDSTFSMMSYRHVYMQFDHFDHMFLGIAHTVAYLEEAHELLPALDADDRERVLGADSRARAHVARAEYADAVAAARDALRLAREAVPPEPAAAAAVPVEEVVALQIPVPASRTLVGSTNLGIGSVPNPVDLDQAGASYTATTFDVPADAAWVRIKYRDAVLGGTGTFKQSLGLVLGPDGSYRGGLFESYEDEVYLTGHWRGAGPHELRIYQFSGTPGLYDVEIGIAR